MIHDLPKWILRYAQYDDKKVDCFGQSPRNDEVERTLLLAKAKSSKNFCKDSPHSSLLKRNAV